MNNLAQTKVSYDVHAATEALVRFQEQYAVTGPLDFMEFEAQLRQQMMGLERELIRRKLEQLDVTAKKIEVNGVTHRLALQSTVTIMTPAGDVEVTHHLFRASGEEKTLSPLLMRAGVFEKMTPSAAKLATFLVTELVPQKAEETLKRIGGMTPCKSTLDRLPKALLEAWDKGRETFDAQLRDTLVVPANAKTLMVSLDGVMAPFREGERLKKREAALAEGRPPRGPAGYREIGVGAVGLCDGDGNLLAAVRRGCVPEPNKLTLKADLTAEVESILAKKPGLRVVGIADGALDNWSFLEQLAPNATLVLDFFHAAEKLSEALASVFGDASIKTQERFNALRHTLRHEDGGVTKVIRALAYIRDTNGSTKALEGCLGYFRRHRHKMDYSYFASQGLPIGSGVVEATCKSLVAQRLKRSGMRCDTEGAEAILTIRGWAQSARFDAAWAVYAASRHAEITIVSAVDVQDEPTIPGPESGPTAKILRFTKPPGASE